MIHLIIQIYIYMIVIDVVLSYAPELRRHAWAQSLRKIVDIPQKPIRDLLPEGLPLDPSPMIVIMLLYLLRSLF